MIDVEKQIKYWVETGADDLATAKGAFGTFDDLPIGRTIS